MPKHLIRENVSENDRCVEWYCEVDEEGDLVIYANRLMILWISRDGELHRCYKGDAQLRQLGLKSDKGRIKEEDYH